MNPIEYLQSKGFKISSDPSKYESGVWGLRNYMQYDPVKKYWINHDAYNDGYHNAFDLYREDGAPLPAVVDGTIVAGTKTRTQGGNFGDTVVLADHKGDYQYIYGHCKNLQVKVGDEVKQGDTLGYQSNTNYAGVYMDSHLHFQTQKQKYYANEKEFVKTGINPLNIDVNKYTSKASTKQTTGNTFLDKVLPYAQSEKAKTKILPSIVMAQAALESAWGTSELAKSANNLFGVKGDYKGKSYTKRTREEDKNGKSYYVNAPFRKYPSFKESILDHGAFFVSSDWRKKNYAPVLNAKDYKTQAKALQSCGYATDTKYANKLINLIEEHDLARFDNNTTSSKTSAKTTANTPKVANSSKQASTKTQTITHSVKKGQTLYSIAKTHGTTVDKIKELNNLKNNTIKLNQKLIVGKKEVRVAKKTPYTIGEWKTNKYGTQYIQARGTFTVGNERILSRFGSPKLSAPQGGYAKPNAKYRYTALLRQDGHVWIEYEASGKIKYLPYNTWDSKTGQTGVAGKNDDWGTFS